MEGCEHLDKKSLIQKVKTQKAVILINAFFQLAILLIILFYMYYSKTNVPYLKETVGVFIALGLAWSVYFISSGLSCPKV